MSTYIDIKTDSINDLVINGLKRMIDEVIEEKRVDRKNLKKALAPPS